VAHGSNTISTLASFNYSNGANPAAGLVEDSNGNLFGTTSQAGTSGYGTVFEVANGSNSITTLASFNSSNGANPYGGLVEDNSGNLFGTTAHGGTSGYGTVFEIANSSNSITTLASFNSSNGANPAAGLVEDSSGNLFGTTLQGGTNLYGTVFEVANGSSSITTLASFNYSNGASPESSLVKDSSGNLFGTTQYGGTHGAGTVFEVANGGNTVTTLASFDAYPNGASPFAALVKDGNGNLFGTTTGGGTSSDGTVFEVAHGSNTITTLASFNYSNGADPIGGLVEDSSGNLFGTTILGGTYGAGTVFEVANGSNSITTLASFNYSNGYSALGTLVEDSSGNLFGTTSLGGTSGYGTVFEVAHGSNTITTLASFNNGNGAFPYGGLVEDSSGNLFGSTTGGGTTGYGTVFEVANSSNSITTLASFNSTTGFVPYGTLVDDSGGNLFGSTYVGGTSGAGTVFEVASGSNSITTLASFSFSNGANPEAGLVEDRSGNLFGTTIAGGTYFDGTVFEVANGSNSITTLASFNRSNGAVPIGGLVEDNSGNLFGTTVSGGASGVGVVFEVVSSDTTPPTTTAVSSGQAYANAHAGWNNTAVTITLSATDPDSGVAATYYTIDGTQYTYTAPFTVSGEGTHKVTYWSVDTASNAETPGSLTVNIDTTAPTTTVQPSSTLTTTYPNPASVSLAATDSGSGVAATYYNVDGGSYTLYNGSFAVSGTGTHSVSYYSVDVAGNQESAKSVSVIINKANQAITWSTPANIIYGTALSSAQLNATVTGVAGGSAPGALTYSPPAGTVLGPGPQTLTVTAAATTDYNQATASVTINVLYNFSGFLAPLNKNMSFNLGKTIPIKFQLSDASGNLITSLSAVSSLQIQALDSNGNPVGAPFNPNPAGNCSLRNDGSQYIFNWQSKGLTAGSYEIVLTLADGTVKTSVLQLTKSGSSAGLTTVAAGGTSAAPGGLLGGDIDLYVDNTNGYLTADELARIQDAVTAVGAVTAPYGVTVVEVTDPTLADVTLNMDTTSAVGGYAAGVLGCTTDAGQITLINGWSFYAGSDATQIGSGQYDFETVVTHELGHALGLGHSTDSTSVMYATLNTGSVNRTLTTADLNVPDTGTTGACGLHAAAVDVGRIGNTSYENGRDMVFAMLAEPNRNPVGGFASLAARDLANAQGLAGGTASRGDWFMAASIDTKPSDPIFAGLLPADGEDPLFDESVKG
jgi:uncharacterized repeat protein (TIGR03803 family)